MSTSLSPPPNPLHSLRCCVRPTLVPIRPAGGGPGGGLGYPIRVRTPTRRGSTALCTHARLSALRPSSPPPAAQAQALPAPPPHARPPLPSSSLAVSPPPPCPHIRMIRLPKSQEKYLDCVAIDSVLIHFSTRHIAESFAKEQS